MKKEQRETPAQNRRNGAASPEAIEFCENCPYPECHNCLGIRHASAAAIADELMRRETAEWKARWSTRKGAKRSSYLKLNEEEALRLYHAGWNDVEISSRLGVPTTTVYSLRRRKRLPANQLAGYGGKRE